MKRLEELALKELDEGLSDAESTELERLLGESEEAIEHYHQLREVEVMLRNLDENFDVTDLVMAEVTRPLDEVQFPRRRKTSLSENFIDGWLLPYGIPAGVIGGLVLAFFLVKGNFFPPEDGWNLQGELQVETSGEIKANERVVAKEDGATIRYRDKTKVLLTSGTEVIYEPDFDFNEEPSKRLELISGSLTADVTKQPDSSPFVLKPPHALAIVRGTRFQLSAGDKQTRLAVSHGRVDLRRSADGATVVVPAGRYVVTTEKGKLKVKRSREREGLIAYYTFEEGRGNRVLDRSGFGKPLNLVTKGPNTKAARWDSSGGLRFPKRAHLQSERAADKIRQACQENLEITIEAWIQPARSNQSGPARIVTASRGSDAVNFMLGQSDRNYQVRLNTVHKDSQDRGEPKILAKTVINRLTHVVFTRKTNGEWRIYIDGKVRSRGKLPGYFTGWKRGLRLGLGDDPNGEDRFWTGTYRLVAIYSKALTDSQVRQNHQAGPDHSEIINP